MKAGAGTLKDLSNLELSWKVKFNLKPNHYEIRKSIYHIGQVTVRVKTKATVKAQGDHAKKSQNKNG